VGREMSAEGAPADGVLVAGDVAGDVAWPGTASPRMDAAVVAAGELWFCAVRSAIVCRSVGASIPEYVHYTEV
jgi:hypothetical protein